MKKTHTHKTRKTQAGTLGKKDSDQEKKTNYDIY